MSGQTIAEKILENASDTDEVRAGDHVVCDVDRAHAQDHTTWDIMAILDEQNIDEVWDPSRIAIVFDHESPPIGEERGVAKANENNVMREFAKEHGIENLLENGAGISHNVLPEVGHVAPGELIIGADSHTTTFGAFGAAATGMGRRDSAFVFATGRQWFRVPETIRFEVEGDFDEEVTEKDLVLHIIEEFGVDVGRYKSVEYTGEAIEALPIGRRMTLSSMGIEVGAKFAFGPVDDVVFDYVDDVCERAYEPQFPDPDAEYAEVHRIDADGITPKISEPHNHGNVTDVDLVGDVNVDVVFIGSCTNGQFTDMVDAAEILDGREVHPDVRLIVTPATRGVFTEMAKSGVMEVLEDAGATVTHPTCGACGGTGPGVLGDNEVCVAAQNRNARGRMGAESAEIYLTSPKTAAASSIAGRIATAGEV